MSTVCDKYLSCLLCWLDRHRRPVFVMGTFRRFLASFALGCVLIHLHQWSSSSTTMSMFRIATTTTQNKMPNSANRTTVPPLPPNRNINLMVDGDNDELEGKCVAVRWKDGEEMNRTFTIEEALQVLHRRQAQGQYLDRPLQMGVIFLDDPDGFISSGKVVDDVGVFHLYHYLEFLLVAYHQWHVLKEAATTAATTSTTPQLSWIYVPLLQSPLEVCGVANGMNCQITNLLWGNRDNNDTATTTTSPRWYGMESNPPKLRALHPAYAGQHGKRHWNTEVRPLFTKDTAQNYPDMQASADLAILISLRHRDRCIHHLNREQNGWTEYAQSFPRETWHTTLSQELSKPTLNISLPSDLVPLQIKSQKDLDDGRENIEGGKIEDKPKMTVCYIDRQATKRRMPDVEHDWLVTYLNGMASSHNIQFWHLFMQDYTNGLVQIKIASECQVLLGVHGNGLSHVVWMEPKQYVLELFFDSKLRQGGYKFLAEVTMHHNYLALRNGHLETATAGGTNTTIPDYEQGRRRIQQFVELAWHELGYANSDAVDRDDSHHPTITTQQLRAALFPPQVPRQRQKQRHVDDWGNTHPRHCQGAVKHIHLAVGHDPSTEMTLTFATQWSDVVSPKTVVGVRFGKRPDQLDGVVLASSTTFYNTTYPADSAAAEHGANDLYYSPYQHHTTLTDLEPDTQYFYLPVVVAVEEHTDDPSDPCTLLKQKTFGRDHPTQHIEHYTPSKEGRWEYLEPVNPVVSLRHRQLAPKPYNPKKNEDGDCPWPSQVRSFTTAPAEQQEAVVRFGILGDLGQFVPSQATMKHMMKTSPSQDRLNAVLLVGDIAYTNNDHRRWDTFFDFLDDYPLFHSTPLLVATGNHDVEKAVGRTEIFQAYEHRFRMPRVHPPQFGTVVDTESRMDMNEPPYPLPYEWGNAYYSFAYGPTKHIVVSAYSSMEPDSPQYQWLVQELQNVDRQVLPWMLVTLHVPLYNTYDAHHRDMQVLAAQEHLEPLLVQYQVNMVFTGHIHAYQRTHPVAFGELAKKGPIHVTVGSSGRQCCLTPEGPDQPWLAKRNGSHYGFGQLTVYNHTHAQWEWIPTYFPGMQECDELPPSDVVVVENQYFL